MEPKYLKECMSYTLNRRHVNVKTFDEANLRVFKRFEYNAQAVFNAIGKGGYVLPIINGDYLGADIVDKCFCAILSINGVKKEVTLYNPHKNEEIIVPIDTFLDTWSKSGADCITAFTGDDKTYKPEIPDFSTIEIPDDLKKLTELLAKHAHDIWATERQSEGWTYGLERNDRKLETPDMIPYEKLPETEKQYDRIMASNTIKLLLANGYKIIK